MIEAGTQVEKLASNNNKNAFFPQAREGWKMNANKFADLGAEPWIY